jgi:hypothetical protein
MQARVEVGISDEDRRPLLTPMTLSCRTGGWSKRSLMKTPDRLRKLPSFRHQHASKRDKFVFLRLIEACV